MSPNKVVLYLCVNSECVSIACMTGDVANSESTDSERIRT